MVEYLNVSCAWIDPCDPCAAAKSFKRTKNVDPIVIKQNNFFFEMEEKEEEEED